MVPIVCDVSSPCCMKTEWKNDSDANLAGEEKRAWWEIGTSLEVVMETVMREC